MPTMASITTTATVIMVLLLWVAAELYIAEVESHAMTAESLKASTLVIAGYEKAIATLKLAQKDLHASSIRLQNEKTEVTRTLHGLRNREKTVLAKRTLVAKKINKAFKKQQYKLACITGDSTACTKQ